MQAVRQVRRHAGRETGSQVDRQAVRPLGRYAGRQAARTCMQVYK